MSDERVAVLHRERLQVLLERQTARNEMLPQEAVHRELARRVREVLDRMGEK